jgi:hypothetical protein
MFLKPLQHFVGEIESRLLRITLFQQFDDTETLLIVIKSPVLLHESVERSLAGMTKGRMAEIVCEGDSLRKILVESEGASHCPANRGHLNGMSETGPIMIARAIEKNLGLPIQTTEGGPVNDTVAIPLIAGAEGMFRFRTQPPCALRSPLGIGSQERFAGG